MLSNVRGERRVLHAVTVVTLACAASCQPVQIRTARIPSSRLATSSVSDLGIRSYALESPASTFRVYSVDSGDVVNVTLSFKVARNGSARIARYTAYEEIELAMLLHAYLLRCAVLFCDNLPVPPGVTVHAYDEPVSKIRKHRWLPYAPGTRFSPTSLCWLSPRGDRVTILPRSDGIPDDNLEILNGDGFRPFWIGLALQRYLNSMKET
jgi:hypothetical protein